MALQRVQTMPLIVEGATVRTANPSPEVRGHLSWHPHVGPIINAIDEWSRHRQLRRPHLPRHGNQQQEPAEVWDRLHTSAEKVFPE